MDRFEQIYVVHRVLLKARYPVTSDQLKEELDRCSTATLCRVIAEMRDYLNAPIESSRQNGGGYWYVKEEGPRYELPGLWFSGREVHALLDGGVSSDETTHRVQCRKEDRSAVHTNISHIEETGRKKTDESPQRTFVSLLGQS